MIVEGYDIYFTVTNRNTAIYGAAANLEAAEIIGDLPQSLPGGCVDCHNQHPVVNHWGRDVHHAIRDYRRGLKARRHSGLNERDQVEGIHVFNCYLLQRRISLVVICAPVQEPIALIGLRT